MLDAIIIGDITDVEMVMKGHTKKRQESINRVSDC